AARRSHPGAPTKGAHVRPASPATGERRPTDRSRRPRRRRMHIVSAAAIPVWTADKLRNWLSARHSLPSEAAAVLGLYGLYELARGLVVGDAREADHHAHRVVALERWLHLFLEANLQHAARALPGLTSLLGIAYLTLHLAVTAGVLLWLHQRRPAAFALVRTTLL